ncbi:MAG: hypothetical protein R3236_09485, partial [Phycisphaeraceae bacterium]|nr:hypothetical protein [Phycisphaeraceae bacterium]
PVRRVRPFGGTGLLALAMLAGCQAAGPTSTRLTADDFDHTVAEIVQKLRSSPFIQNRNPQSPQARVVINKVENLTDDVISPAEQWMVMARVRSGLSINFLRQQKNIVFMIPPERFDRLRRSGFQGDLGPRKPATHVMKAVFRSSVRVGDGNDAKQVDSRSDYYFLEFVLQEIQSREEKWVDHVEFKRAAKGLLID